MARNKESGARMSHFDDLHNFLDVPFSDMAVFIIYISSIWLTITVAFAFIK